MMTYAPPPAPPPILPFTMPIAAAPLSSPSSSAYPPAIPHPPDAVFHQDLALTRGPRPAFYLVVWPVAGVVSGDGDIPWSRLIAYSIRDVPDGYTIHAGVEPPQTSYNEHGFDAWNVTFAKSGEHLDGDWAFVCYHGIHYLRGQMTQDDVPNLEQHRTFQVFTGYEVTSQEKQMAGVDGLVHLTIPLAQTWKQAAIGMPLPGGTFVLQFPQEQHMPLDRHTWEPW